MTITSSRKPEKLGGRLSSGVEYWDVNPKVRGSIPRVSRIYRVKRMILIMIIDYNYDCDYVQNHEKIKVSQTK